MFNLVLVSGVSVALAPFTIPQNSTIAGMNASLVMDIPVMFAVMLLLTVPALLKGKLSRPQGIALLCIYAAFCVVPDTGLFLENDSPLDVETIACNINL